MYLLWRKHTVCRARWRLVEGDSGRQSGDGYAAAGSFGIWPLAVGLTECDKWGGQPLRVWCQIYILSNQQGRLPGTLARTGPPNEISETFLLAAGYLLRYFCLSLDYTLMWFRKRHVLDLETRFALRETWYAPGDTIFLDTWSALGHVLCVWRNALHLRDNLWTLWHVLHLDTLSGLGDMICTYRHGPHIETWSAPRDIIWTCDMICT
jgi:hypothetical protein